MTGRIRPSAYPLRHAENNTRNVVATDDKKEKVFSSADTDSRWVGDLITVHAVNVKSSCFKCPLMREEQKTVCMGARQQKLFLMIDVYGVTYGAWSETKRPFANAKKKYSAV